MEDFHYSNLSS